MPHVEFTREIARRFNHLYGREPGFEEKAQGGGEEARRQEARKLYRELRTAFQEQGDDEALAAARALLDEAQNLPLGDRERLFGYLEGGGKMILPEPQALLTEASKMPGPRRPEDVEVATATRSRCARTPAERRRRRSARCRPTRRACSAPIRAIRRNARCGSCTRSIRTTTTKRWVQQGLHDRRHRLPRMQAAGDRRDHRASRSRCASARSSTSTTRAGAQHRRRRLREARASSPRKRCATCARRWAWRHDVTIGRSDQRRIELDRADAEAASTRRSTASR